MTAIRLPQIFLSAAGWISVFAAVQSADAAEPSGVTLDETASPGANYGKAEFRTWIPEGAGPLNAVIVLVPGSNGDGRSMAGDSAWQAFAGRLRLGLLGCRFTDRPHDQDFIEQY